MWMQAVSKTIIIWPKTSDFLSDTLNGVERKYHHIMIYKFKYKELGYEYELNDITTIQGE